MKKFLAVSLLLLVAAIVGGGIYLVNDRYMLRRVINLIGSRDKEKPDVFHEYEGYSPGIQRSRHGVEDFNRYHYYLAPDKEEIIDSDPQIYFRQDYEAIEPEISFDEAQYWREHPLNFDSDIPTNDNNDLENEPKE